MTVLSWAQECQIQNHHLINGEEIRIFMKFFQVESELVCDVCQKPRWWQVITKKNRVWCFPCRRLLDTGRLVKRMTNKRNNSDEEIEEAVRKLCESKNNILYE